MTQTRKEALTDLLEQVEARAEISARNDYTTVFDGVNATRAVFAGSGSLDAARALHEEVLPRHYAQVHMWPMPEMCRVNIGGGHTGRDDNPARAWLIAILKALIAQEPDQ